MIAAAAGVCIILLCLRISMVLTEPDAHISPDYPRQDILPVLSKNPLSDSDYQFLFFQTGLGRSAIDELRTAAPDYAEILLRLQENFFSPIHYLCEKNSPVSREESVVDESGNPSQGTELAVLHNGYILITKSSHTYGWRNGHAALVIDEVQGLTLESVVLGTDSCLQDIGKWTRYPNFMLLRLKDASPVFLNEIAQSAFKHLNNIPYDLTVGLLSSKFKQSGEIRIRSTHCSHLVWSAFRLFNVDLDSDGGKLVTPKDIANSPALEVVQVYGVDPAEIWP